MFFPDIIGQKSFFLANNEFLCDRYYDFLSETISAHKRILIHGDTGIGKTHFANKLNTDKNVIVIVPYIAHMDNYPMYRQIEYDSKSTEIISNGVVIWDRFIKLYDKNLIDKESIILVDESHKLFLDQTYREAAVKMNYILKDIANHICYMSATPINEINVEKTYRFEKERRQVSVNHMKIIPEDEDPISSMKTLSSTLMINAMLHLIYGNINYYDHIFIASDKYAQKIFDRLYGKYDCQLIRANQKDSQEYIDLMRTQLLKHKIIIGTCISYESLNFNNRNEKILTITDMNENTTKEIIMQIAGRVRFSYNNVYLIELINTIEDKDYKEEAEFYNKLDEIKAKYNIYSKKHYVQTYFEEIDTVRKWYYENNNIDKIKEDLPLYIKWRESEILAHNISDKSPLNEKVKEYIIEHTEKYNSNLNDVDVIIDEVDYNTFMFFDKKNFIKINEDGQSAYIIRENIRNQQYEYNKLLQYIDYDKINTMMVKSHTMPKGIHSEIEYIIDIIRLNDDKYNSYINELENYMKNITYPIGYSRLKDTIKKIKKIKENYSICHDDNELTMYRKIFDRCVKIKTDKYIRKQKQWKDIGTSNSKHVTITDKFKHPEKYNLNVGQEFESHKALSEYTGKSIQSVNMWKNKTWIT